MKILRPSDLLAMARRGQLPAGSVSVDTETSGLYADSGARISTVSVGWIDPQEDDYRWREWVWGEDVIPSERMQDIDGGSIQTWDIEKIDEWDSDGVISFAWAFDQGVAGTGKNEDSGQSTLWSDADNLDLEEWVALLEWLELVGALHGLDFQNAKFDLHMFRVGVRRWPGVAVDLVEYLHWDTQNGSDMLWGMTGTSSLKPTARRLWGEAEGDEQDVIKRYLTKKNLPSGRWDLMPWDIIAKYADQDARLTARLVERQMMELRITAGVAGWFDGIDGRMTAEEALRRRLETSKMLYRVERRGLPFNIAEARASALEIARRVAKLEKTLPFKPATLPMAKHYWFGEGIKGGIQGLGRTPYSVTEQGQPQLDKTVITKMVRDGLPGAEIWRDIQKLNTADSKWYSAWADRAGEDNRLRTSVRQNGTVSGRFSVENIQLQAIPHDYRLGNFQILDGIQTPRALIGAGVPAGWKLWELDLAQAELRVAALFAKCERMLRLIDEGADLHADAARELFNIEPTDPSWGEMRQVAKRFNFSAIFGIGKDKLQVDIEEQTGILFSLAELDVLLKGWHSLYPEFKRAIYSTMDVVDKRMRSKDHGNFGWITLGNGERRWFKPGEETHKAFNQRVQPSLAQFGIDWWLTVENYLMGQLGDQEREQLREGEYSWIGRVGMVLMVHDSMVLLLPDDARGVEMVEWAIEAGVSLWRERFPGVPGGVDATEWSAHS